MDKPELIRQIARGYEEWETLLAQVGPSRMTEAGVMGDWTVKDIVAHVAWYEWWTGEFIRTRTWPVVPPHLDHEDTEDRNNAYYREMKDVATAEILASARRSHDELMAALEPLTAEEFTTPALLGMPDEPGWALTVWLPENTVDHYREHGDAIRAWLAEQSD